MIKFTLNSPVQFRFSQRNTSFYTTNQPAELLTRNVLRNPPQVVDDSLKEERHYQEMNHLPAS
ncbi:hypothetical protein SLEP1_g10394 [Rubroshorea leprosula]|uniref:Uncharacterized protein n=1 Tax=Rubroshorea leprosula TaxID=152421 RepID=A0AAV5IIX0_9ROSI|nr:hypothetical protein SLEP1_g10394 [Rubroshorea leprosula]